MGKKKFIDKKNSATFQLLYRASSDGQELGEERVYTRVDNNLYQVPELEGGDDDDESRFDDADAGDGELPWEKLRRELLEMGFPDDGYNYMQHMRAVGAGGGTLFIPTTGQEIGDLPVDVKAYDASRVHVEESSAEKDVVDESFTSIRRLQAKSFDHDVRAALDDSEGGDESDLEDDFILLANKEDEGECSSRAPPAVDSHQGKQEPDQHVNRKKASDERSVRLVDEQFEVLALKEYDDDDEFEDEDDPRAKGSAELSQFESIFDEFLAENPLLCGRQATLKSEKRSAQQVAEDEEDEGEEEKDDDDGEEADEFREEVEAVWVDDDDDVRETWDVESIVSTFSNLDNHPTRIGCPGGVKKRVQFSSVVASAAEQTIRLGGRQKLPVDFIGKPLKASGKTSSGDVATPASTTRGETREERKAHKAAVKEERRASRKAKKEMKTEFKRAAQKAQAGAAGEIPRSIKL